MAAPIAELELTVDGVPLTKILILGGTLNARATLVSGITLRKSTRTGRVICTGLNAEPAGAGYKLTAASDAKLRENLFFVVQTNEVEPCITAVNNALGKTPKSAFTVNK